MAAKVCVGRLMCACMHVVSTFKSFFHLCEGSPLLDLKSHGLTIYVGLCPTMWHHFGSKTVMLHFCLPVGLN